MNKIINGCILEPLSKEETADFAYYSKLGGCEPRKYFLRYPEGEIDAKGYSGIYVNSIKQAREASKEPRQRMQHG